VEKMSSIVTFKRVGNQYRGEVRIGVHTLDGVELPPSRVQSAFVACVKRRFDSHALSGGSRKELDGTRMAISNPFSGASVIVKGELGRQRAVEVVAHQLELARAHCGTQAGRVSVVVDTNPDGSPGAVAVTGAAGTTACVEKRLMKTLRFPVVASRNRVELPQPAPVR